VLASAWRDYGEGDVSGYDFFIERDGAVIDRSDWDAVVASRSDLSPHPDYPAGTVIAWDRAGAAEAGYVEWFEPGSIIIRMDVGNGDDLEAMIGLAGQVAARLVGESGEIYHADGTVEG